VETKELYLSDTAIAVRHLFDGLTSYEVPLPSLRDYEIDPGGPIVMPREVGARYLKALSAGLALETARNVLAGGILEVAFQAINLLGPKPHDCPSIHTKMSDKQRRYCVGREVFGMPIGLIIYAGRNQYAHWDSGENLCPLNMEVLNTLTCHFWKDQMHDLAFDVGLSGSRPLAFLIVRLALRWQIFEDYAKDINSVFGGSGPS
jgi:hypothetical protein